MTYIGIIMVGTVLGYYMNDLRVECLDKHLKPLGTYVMMIALSCLLHWLCIKRYGFQIPYYIYFTITIVILMFALVDVCTMHIPTELIIVSGVIGIISNFLNPGTVWYINMISGVGVFLVMWLLGKALRGGIGSGDIYIMALLALYLGWKHAVVVFAFALILSAMFGVVLLIFGKANRKTVLPFIPFIAIVQIALLLL